MKIGIMQPYFFPYIGYWQLINAADEYVIYDDVNYIKRGWINRNNILFNGKAKRINLLIKDASQNRLIKDTQIVQTKEDTHNFMNLLMQSYKKAPYFNQVYGLINQIMNSKYCGLSEYLENQIREVCKYLQIETRIILSSEIEKDSTLRGEEKIIAICQKRNADCYINAIGGKELYHHKKFEEKKMKLQFLRTGDICYKQFENEFVPMLSIIDVMMFNSVEEIKKILELYSLED